MATNFPTSLDALTNPTSGSALNSPSHADQHADANDAIEALQAKVGVNGSAVTTSLDYKVENGVLPKLNVDSGVLVVDANNNRVGVNVSSPAHALDVVGRVEARAAATQDGVAIVGRAGGTSSFDVALTPTTLTADRTLTLPNVSGTAITTGNLTDITATGTVTSGTWSGSFGAVSGANLTTLNASNLSSGTVASARVSGSYTGITGVGTLSAGSIPVSLITGLAASATTDTTNAGNISSGTLLSARMSGSYTGISRVGTLDCASNVFINDTGAVFGMTNTTATGTGNAAHWLLIFGAYFLYRNTSTRDDKENFQPLNGVVTPSMVDQINVELWNRKTAPGLPEIGPMAEDMDAISPFLSTRGIDADADGNIIPTPPTGINQNGWLSLLTVALQDCRQRIVELENR